MPCYDAPPEWWGDYEQDGIEAAKLLCAMVGGAPDYRAVPRPILEWYLRHRRLDLRMARDPRSGSPAETPNIEQDIAVLEHVLTEG